MAEIIMGKIIDYYKGVVLVICLTLFVLPGTSSMAAYQEDDLFERGYEYYLSYQPEKALEYFDLFLRTFPDSSAKDAALFWKAKSLMQLNRTDEAKKIFSEIKESSPNSPFVAYSDRELSAFKKELSIAETNVVTIGRKTVTGELAKTDRDATLKELEKEKAVLSGQLAEIKKLHELTEKGLAKAIEDKNRLEAQLEESRKNNEDLSKKIAAITGEKNAEAKVVNNAQMEADMKNLRAERDILKNQILEFGNQDKEIQALKTRVSEYENQYKKTAADLQELKGNKEALEKATVEKDRHIAESERSIALLSKKVKETDEKRVLQTQDVDKAVTLSSDKPSLEDEIKKKQTIIEELTIRVAEREKEKNSSEALLKKLKEEKAATEEKVKNDEARLAAQEDEIMKERKKTSELSGKGDRTEVLAKELRDAEQKSNDLQRQVDEYKKQISVRENEKETLLAKLNKTEESLKKNNDSLQGVKEELDRKDKENHQFAQKYKDADSELKQISQKNIVYEKIIKEKDLKIAEISKVQSERDVSVKKAEELRVKDGEIRKLTVKIEEQSREKETSAILLKKLTDEKTAVEEKLKANEIQLSALEKTLKEERLRKDNLAGNRKQTDSVAKELKESEEKIKELDKQLTQSRNQINDQRKEKQILLARLAEADEVLKTNAYSLQKIKEDYDRTKKTNDSLSAHDSNSVRELSALKETIKQYEIPVVTVEKKDFSLKQILDDYRTSSEVVKKIKADHIVWRYNNPYDDFIIERSLFVKASESGVKEDRNLYNSLLSQHSLNEREKEYLVRYLTISNFIKKKLPEIVADEKYMKTYYELNKEKYFISSEKKQAKILSLRYSPREELEKSLVALDLLQEASNGKSLELIYKSNSDILSFEMVNVSELPVFIQGKIAGLKDGDISDVISYDNKFVILQMQFNKASYRRYEDVYKEMQKKVFEDQALQTALLHEWFNELIKGARLIK